MKAYTSNNIRNIAVLGHGGKGKTTLCEAMLYLAGATDRLGKVADGNTVLDFDAEEKRKKSSVSSAMAAIEWDNTKLNIIDAPGLFDFEGGICEGFRAAETAMIVVSAKDGVNVQVKGALLNGELLSAAQIEEISKLPTKLELIASLMGTMKAPVQKLAATLLAYVESKGGAASTEA